MVWQLSMRVKVWSNKRMVKQKKGNIKYILLKPDSTYFLTDISVKTCNSCIKIRFYKSFPCIIFYNVCDCGWGQNMININSRLFKINNFVIISPPKSIPQLLRPWGSQIIDWKL